MAITKVRNYEDSSISTIPSVEQQRETLSAEKTKEK